MSTPPQDPARDTTASGYDDRTRDIRRPSLPDGPPAVVRPDRRSPVRPAAAEPVPPSVPVGQSGPDTATEPAAAVRTPDSAPPRPYVLPDEPTDELPPPVRQPTLAFDAPERAAQTPHTPPQGTGSPQPGPSTSGSPVPAVPGPPASHGTPSSSAAPGRAGPPERRRRWPWVVLTVLPVLVIVAAGLLLFLLLGAA